MKAKTPLYWILVAIAAMTVLSGAAQIIMPSTILGFFKSGGGPESAHFFGIIGMFMVLFGAVMLNALLGYTDQPVAVFWASMQKFGASVAVALAVINGIMSNLAWGVAGLDLLTGLLGLWYWFGLPK